ncbi:MAG TPA: beta-propeller fold lactonase family protein [Ignavibacteria bacterium]|nr:beta-propeller fold lactonase family protein [Ignavibacteria bacterium]HMR41825.1 beta-propeller fold lactonase family protein [Ignavibacteria bacterium]
MKNKNLILSLLILITAFIFSSCSDDQSGIVTSTNSSTDEIPDFTENGQNPDDLDLSKQADQFGPGYLYLESNDATINSILVYKQYFDGTITLQSTVESGGSGTGGGLGNQGAIALENGNWLFAVNAGSGSVSSFKMSHSGNLTLKNTIESGGKTPVSLTVHGRILYVVNAGSDNIAGFKVMENGSFQPIPGSLQTLSTTGAGAAQISFAPNGRYLYVTEKATNMITIFPVNGQGVAGPGNSMNSTGQTPFGFDFARNRFMIVSNAAGGAPNQSSATSYANILNGIPNPVNGAVGNNQAAACWVGTTKHGSYAYVTNTASNNISSYYVAPFGAIFVANEAMKTDDGPTEIIVSKNNLYVHVLNAASHTITSFRRTIIGGLELIGTTSGIPVAATGIAAD